MFMATDYRDELNRLIQSDLALSTIASAFLNEIDEPVEKTIAQTMQGERKEIVRLLVVWLRVQQEEIRSMGRILQSVAAEAHLKNRKVRSRMESQEYLRIVKKSFRIWSSSLSEMKQNLIKNILLNSATKRFSPDSVIETFIDWIDRYSDEHFRVIHSLASSPVPLTRKEIWKTFSSHIPPEDSADTDMYKLVIHDLTTGHIIRQVREKDYFGRFLRQSPKQRSGTALAPVIVSAFDDEKPYQLTELGKQLVQYAFTEDNKKQEQKEDAIFDEK